MAPGPATTTNELDEFQMKNTSSSTTEVRGASRRENTSSSQGCPLETDLRETWRSFLPPRRLGSASTPTLRHQWQLEILNLRCQETEPKNAGFVDIATSTRGP